MHLLSTEVNPRTVVIAMLAVVTAVLLGSTLTSAVTHRGSGVCVGTNITVLAGGEDGVGAGGTGRQ